MPAVYFKKETQINYPEKLKIIKQHEDTLYLKSIENGDSLIAELVIPGS